MKTRAEITRSFRAKYEELRSSFWGIGPLESNRMSRIGDVYVCDLGQNGRAAFVMYEDGNVVEVHGGIYEFWKQKGGANGELGLPVSDEADYRGPEARPGDRVSEFENGIAVWRADTWQTEVHDKSEVPNASIGNEMSCPSSNPQTSDAGSFTASADPSVGLGGFVLDPDACVMENMERAIEAGYSEDEVRAMFLGV